MTFLQFFGYFLASKLIIDFSIFGIYLLRHFYLKRKLQNAINAGQIQFTSQDDFDKIIDSLNKQDKKTWN
jgi:hypothetical protein